MGKIFSANGSTGSPTADPMCSGLSGGKTDRTWELDETGGGTTQETCTPNTLGIDQHTLELSSAANTPNETSWPAGDWIVQIDVAVGNVDVDWASAWVCRMDSGGTNQETIGNLSGQTETMSAGNHTLTVSGSSATALASDQFYVVCGMSDTRGAGSHGTVAITADQTETEVDSPFTAAVTVDVPVIAAGTAILAPRVDRTVPVPAVSAGTAILAPSVRFDQSPDVPTIAAATDILAPRVDRTVDIPAIAAATAILAPQVNRTVSVPSISAGTAILAPQVVFDQFPVVPTIATATAILAPRVDRTVPVPAIAAATAIIAPSIVASQAVPVPFIAAGTDILAPRVDRTVTVPAIPAGTAIVAPTVRFDQFPVVPTIAAATAILAPRVDRTVPIPAVGAGTAILAPSIVASQSVAVPAIAAATTILAPSIATGAGQNVTVPAIAAGTASLAPQILINAAVVPSISAGTAILAPSIAAETQDELTPPQGTILTATTLPLGEQSSESFFHSLELLRSSRGVIEDSGQLAHHLEENFQRIMDFIGPFGGQVPGQGRQLARLLGGVILEGFVTGPGSQTRFTHNLGRIPQMIVAFWNRDAREGVILGRPEGVLDTDGVTVLQSPWTETEVFVRSTGGANYRIILD